MADASVSGRVAYPNSTSLTARQHVHKTSYSQPPRDPVFSLGKAILFEMDPERAHELTLQMLAKPWLQRRLATRYAASTGANAVNCLGMSFGNRIGLAAGLDKNGDYIDALGALGFAHIEIGTITPKPQPGNPQPRLFRLPEHKALINRFGFNNKGVDHLASRVEQRRYPGILGINIGKNVFTSLSEAHNDYTYCLERVYPLADYISVNISSPNTTGLRDLQHGERLNQLLHSLKSTQVRLATIHARQVPIAVKIAPDMSDEALDDFCRAVIEHEIDAVIAGNTTQERAMLGRHFYATESGGLSGAPLRPLADDRLRAVAERLDKRVVLIGVGGVGCGEHAKRKLAMGAELVQLYTGLIYHGPALVRDCIEATRY